MTSIDPVFIEVAYTVDLKDYSIDFYEKFPDQAVGQYFKTVEFINSEAPPPGTVAFLAIYAPLVSGSGGLLIFNPQKAIIESLSYGQNFTTLTGVTFTSLGRDFRLAHPASPFSASGWVVPWIHLTGHPVLSHSPWNESMRDKRFRGAPTPRVGFLGPASFAPFDSAAFLVDLSVGCLGSNRHH